MEVAKLSIRRYNIIFFFFFFGGNFEKYNSIISQAFHFESFLGNFLITFKSISQICQFAELNPNALFLKVNYEELKTMCHGLNIHVLPLFRFYRGANGRLCSFSCTNATVSVSFNQIKSYFFISLLFICLFLLLFGF